MSKACLPLDTSSDAPSARLIVRFEDKVVSGVDSNQMSLVHHAVTSGNSSCADSLFAYAAGRIPIDLCWPNGDILQWSLDNYNKESVQFVLEKMSQRCATPTQTIEVLSRNLEKLVERFPSLAEKCLREDSFCFEFGRFPVHRHIFDNAYERPIGMLRDSAHGDLAWKAESESEAREFWENERPDLKNDLLGQDGEHVMAVSKFVVVEDIAVSSRKNSVADLVAAKCSVDVFKCETVRTIVQWKWNNYQLFAFVLSNSIVYLTSVFFFFLFVVTYGEIASESGALEITDVTNDHGSSSRRLAQVSLACSFLALVFPIVLRSSSLFW